MKETETAEHKKDQGVWISKLPYQSRPANAKKKVE